MATTKLVALDVQLMDYKQVGLHGGLIMFEDVHLEGIIYKCEYFCQLG